MDHLIGQDIGRYKICELLGEGGMASVYRATDRNTGQDVALKFIRYDAFPRDYHDKIKTRFEREARQVMAMLDHANIVSVLDTGEFEGASYLVMKYYRRGALKIDPRQPFHWRQALRILIPIARALDYAHHKGFIHRDVKPANILITESGDPMLSDFGVAKIRDLKDDTSMTAVGVPIGTPDYMPPEQWEGNPEPKSDVYALGMVFYEMVTGKRPFHADTPAEVWKKHAQNPLPPPRNFVYDLPKDVEKLIIWSLAKNPAERLSSMAAFVEAMEGILEGRPVEPSQTLSGMDTAVDSDFQEGTAPAGVGLDGRMLPPGEGLFAADDLGFADARPIQPPVYSPPIRAVLELPEDEVVIPAPPAAGRRSPADFLPAAAAAGAGVLCLAGGGAAWALDAPALLLWLLLGAGPVLWAAGAALFFSGRKSRERSWAVQMQRYAREVDFAEQRLAELKKAQIEISTSLNPGPEVCLACAQLSADQPLWERGSRDEDFLDVRVGVGSLPVRFRASYAGEPPAPGADALLRRAAGLPAKFARVEPAPVLLPIRQAAVTGVVGDRPQIQNLGRLALLQLATHHHPKDVKVVVIFPEQERKEWIWARWLPHVWDDSHTTRFLAGSPQEISALIEELAPVLAERAEARKTLNGETASVLPQYVIFIADPAFGENTQPIPQRKLIENLLNEPAAKGISVVFFQATRGRLHPSCKTILSLKDPPQLTLERAAASQDFQPDLVSLRTAEMFARRLAPIRFALPQEDQEQPAEEQGFTLFQLLGIVDPQDIPLVDNWAKNSILVPLAGPIGRSARGQVVFSLQDGAAKGYGPHALVSGKAGTGKTKGILQTIILSLAIENHPSDVNFVLVDYHGDDLQRGLEALPHIAGMVGRIESDPRRDALIKRLFSNIDLEIARRKQILGKQSINDFHADQRSLGVNSDKTVPHLVIVIDGFADLIASQKPPADDLLKDQLAGIVQNGRSVGVHLLLADRDPGKVIPVEAMEHYNCSLIALKDEVSWKGARSDTLTEAAESNLGNFVFSANRENIYVQAQIAFSGAPGPNTEKGTQAVARQVYELGLNGRTGKQLFPEPGSRASTPRSKTFAPAQTQAEALVKEIAGFARLQNIPPNRNPLVPLLPEQVDMDAVRPFDQGWNGKTWAACDRWLAPVVGVGDDRGAGTQNPLQIPLASAGNLVIYSSDMDETRGFLTTLLYSVVLDHSPAQANVYILDFDDVRLPGVEHLPHVGAYVTAAETEQIPRVLSFLSSAIKKRKGGPGETGQSAGNHKPFRDSGSPELILVVNHFSQFEQCSTSGVELFVKLLEQDPASVGVHVILTATQPAVVLRHIARHFKMAAFLCFEQSPEIKTIAANDPSLDLAGGMKGRGLFYGTRRMVFQTALVNAQKIAEEIELGWNGGRAVQVPKLPDQLSLSAILKQVSQERSRVDPNEIPVGLGMESLEIESLHLNDGPYFLVTGRPQGGKTCAIQTMTLTLAYQYPESRLQVVLLNLGAKNQQIYALRSLPHFAAYADTPETVSALIQGLQVEIHHRNTLLNEAIQAAADQPLDEQAFMARFPKILLVSDDYDQLKEAEGGSALALSLDGLLRTGKKAGLHAIIGVPLRWVQNQPQADPVIQTVLECQSGLLFERSGVKSLFHYQVPKMIAGTMAPGRGFVISKGVYRSVQAASAALDGSTAYFWIQKIKARSSR
jgi:S-DNA-T family DNA segregation ATPase FtsK/SpoIIIE